METDNSSIIPKEAALARLSKLIDCLNDYDQRVSKLLDEIKISSISPFAIPGWPRNFQIDKTIDIKKEILYPSKALGGISLTKILAYIKVYIFSGYISVHVEQIQKQPSKLLSIKPGKDERTLLEVYGSSPTVYSRDDYDDKPRNNHPIDIACCLIIFCQLINEVCEGIEKELQEQLVRKSIIAESCREIPALVRRCFEPLVPFVVADALAQE